MSTRGRWVCSRCGGMKDAKGACPVCDEPPREHRSEALAAMLEAGRIVDRERFGPIVPRESAEDRETVIDAWLEEAVRWIEEAWPNKVLSGSGTGEVLGLLDPPTLPEITNVSLDMIDTVRLSPPEHAVTDSQLRASTVVALAAFRAR